MYIWRSWGVRARTFRTPLKFMKKAEKLTKIANINLKIFQKYWGVRVSYLSKIHEK
jgi:hypothetical protein